MTSNNTLLRRSEQAFVDPDVATQEQRVRDIVANKGYRLMHRGRKGQYWLMNSTPWTLDEIEEQLIGMDRI